MLSIIIPTLNEEKIIGETLKNLRLNLTRFSYELIVTDGPSTDRTPEIAREYADTVLHETERTTIANGKNLGADAAKGEFLLFLDADMTIPNPDAFLALAFQDFERDPHLVGLTVNLRVHPEMATWADNLIFGAVNLTHRFNNNVTHTGSASGEFQMVRTAAFRKAGGYRADLAVAEDNEFFKRLARLGRTKMEHRLTVFHTGRRAHRIGWPRLLWEWGRNWFSVMLFKRSADKEWKVIR